MDWHHIQLVKGLGASWAFAHAVADAIVNALVAKQMTAGLKSGILEIVAANSAQSESLLSLAWSWTSQWPAQVVSTYSQHFLLLRGVAHCLTLPTVAVLLRMFQAYFELLDFSLLHRVPFPHYS